MYRTSFFIALLGAGITLFSSCKIDANDAVVPEPASTQKRIVKGRVVDSQGKPVPNAEIIASSTDYYNKTTTGYTDASGNYRIQLPNGIAEGSYTASGTVTIKYHGQNFRMALYEEDSRVFSAYDGAVRNFVFRLTGKRAAQDDASALPLGGKIEVHCEYDQVIAENVELTLEPAGPLVDGSAGTKIVRMLPKNIDYLNDIPVGQYKITARDIESGKLLGVSVKDSFKPYATSVTALFKEANFEGDTNYELILLVGSL